MLALIRREYRLNGLCCPRCGEAIRQDAASLSGVVRAELDFSSQRLVLALEDNELLTGLAPALAKLVAKHEPGVEILELPPPGYRTLHLSQTLPEEVVTSLLEGISHLPGLAGASLAGQGQEIRLEAERDGVPAPTLRAARTRVTTSCPGVRVSNRPPPGQAEGAGRGEFYRRLRLGLAIPLFVAAFLVPAWVAPLVFTVAYLLAGFDIIVSALRKLVYGRVFDENFLMTLASLGAFSLGEYPEGVAVIILYQIGEGLERLAVGRSRRSISHLLEIRPQNTCLLTPEGQEMVEPEEVGVGETIVVRPGERVPLDGKVETGNSRLDVSALTGESYPQTVGPGDGVLAGAINQNGFLTLRVEREFADSTLSRIVEMVATAGRKKARLENTLTVFARYYTPLVVVAAFLLAVLPPVLLTGADFSDWLHRALVFLVASCPCALVISIPLGFFGGIGGAARRGILVRGANALEALARVNTLVFDKTGTLTEGRFRVVGVEAAPGWQEKDLLSLAAHAESRSSHPVAQSLLTAWGGAIEPSRLGQGEEIPGQGVRMTVDGREVRVGNRRLVGGEEENPGSGGGVFVGVDGVYAGTIFLDDAIRKQSKPALGELRRLGVRHLALFSGDQPAVAERVGRELGMDQVEAGLLPGEKVERLEELRRGRLEKGSLVFVGDGINDAPALARSDVGIAMGGGGADIAIEAADVVLLADDPGQVAVAVAIARRTRHIVWENIVFALGVKAVILLAGALGWANLWMAVFGDVGVAFLAVLNATRTLWLPGGSGSFSSRQGRDDGTGEVGTT